LGLQMARDTATQYGPDSATTDQFCNTMHYSIYVNTQNDESNTGSKRFPLSPSYGNEGPAMTSDINSCRHFALGSSHPDMFHILLGDGSVATIRNSMNPNLIVLLTIVNDGAIVALP